MEQQIYFFKCMQMLKMLQISELQCYVLKLSNNSY